MTFDHATVARFDLTGRHRTVACRQCHLNLRFDEPKVLGTDCGSCHADVHRSQFGDRCASCHIPTTFREVPTLQIHSRTGFPLTGAHGQLACRACHVDDQAGAYSPVDPACLSCHQEDYETARPVDHVAAGFPTECQQCHVALAWTFAIRFDHAGVSGGYQLVAAHARLRCGTCHEGGTGAPIYSPANQNDCIACHTDDYQRAHSTFPFPTTCTGCHGQDTWAGAQFDHALASGGYQLVGAHAQAPCSSCHDPGTGAPLFSPASPDDCVTCHEADYQREHAGSGFPTTCAACHGQETWEGADFRQHDQQAFPIYSGTHARRWQECQDCHVQPGNFSVFSCLTCHTQGETDGHHREEGGYRYESAACYSCHPTGRAGD
jgi:hypothetical protein